MNPELLSMPRIQLRTVVGGRRQEISPDQMYFIHTASLPESFRLEKEERRRQTLNDPEACPEHALNDPERTLNGPN